MKVNFFFRLSTALTALRTDSFPFDKDTQFLWANVRDLIWRGVDDGFIDIDQSKRFFHLAANALVRSGTPFPDTRNSGPFMPDSVWYQRHMASVKLQAVPDNEPVQPQPVAACPELRLLCMLDAGRNGKTRSLPVHTLQPLQAPWSAVSRKWSLVLPDGLEMRETYAKQPTAEVLERYSRLGQANTVCASVGTH